MSIQVNHSENNNTVTMVISGRFDFSLHKVFREAYREQGAGAEYLVDLKNAEYMDSSALGMLLLLREHAGGERARIRIQGCNPDIRKIFVISNFHKLFDIQ